MRRPAGRTVGNPAVEAVRLNLKGYAMRALAAVRQSRAIRLQQGALLCGQRESGGNPDLVGDAFAERMERDITPRAARDGRYMFQMQRGWPPVS